tara:strand:+ start:4424 stop:4858 length:435 start_codon:yes stop_codon:yes gene_type:complete
MASINTYLTFNGQCEEAFLFYASVFGTKIAHISKFSEMPSDPRYPMNEADLNRVMHVTLPISEHTVLMGSDTGGEWSSAYKMGNNFSISINADSKEEADRLFNQLATGGKVIMPMETTFWNSYFGMMTDPFGIQWMVSFDTTKA